MSVPTWEELSAMRWACADAKPGIDISSDWRDEANRLPHAAWMAWREKSAEMVACGFPRDEAERLAFEKTGKFPMGVAP